MENNNSDNPVTPTSTKGPDQLEQSVPSTTVSAKPPEALTPQAPDASNREDVGVTKLGSTQAKDSSEAQPDGREASSAEAKPSGSGSTTGTQSYVPPVKRFSAVNINKKFLQKNQTSTSSSGGATSNTPNNRQSGVIARPAPQTAHSHSRLVTAKLTASPVSSSPGPGWSRPSSVTPPVPSPAGSSATAKGPAPTSTIAAGGPSQVAPGGKIIQPQVLKQKMEGPGKTAWRNIHPGAISSGLQAQKEFPTAAEAAQSRVGKASDAKAASSVPDTQKQVMSETADAFRGVHLDPNAHHWDEMEEEDNDDFLGGDVIEFGDGRQYTIHISEEATADAKALEDHPSLEGPVSKEDRFVDDFDRSWPKSRQESGKGDSVLRGRPATSSNFPRHPSGSMRDAAQSRVLFNERLNRMEPIPGGRPGPGAYGQPRGVQIHRDRPEREAPPHSALRRSHEPAWDSGHGRDQHARDLRELKSETIASYFHDGHYERRGRPERPSSRSRDGLSPDGRPFGSREASGARSTVNGAPSVASSDHSSRYAPSAREQRRVQFPQSGRHRDMERQLPPHLMQPFSTGHPEKSPTDADSHTTRYAASVGTPTESTSGKDQDQSRPEPGHPAQGQTDVGVQKPTQSIPPDDVEALRKAYLHEAAERAKIRRQQEEEAFISSQERARKKAAELEAKMAAAKVAEEAKFAPQPTANQESSMIPISTADSDKKPSEIKKPTEAEVIKVIEGAIGSAVPSKDTSDSKTTDLDRRGADGPKSSFAKALSQEDSTRSSSSLEPQDMGQPKLPALPAKADQVDSWRAKPKPPVLPVENSKNDISQESAASVLPDVHAFDIQADESTEVIDFSDVGRLAGDRIQKPVSQVDSTSSRPPRAVASDFFKGSSGQRSEQDSWRRSNAAAQRSFPAVVPDNAYYRKSSGDIETAATSQTTDETGGQRANGQLHSRAPISQANGSIPPSVPGQPAHPSSPGVPKFLRSPNISYREAPLSALDDTMSRIKGALDIMHSAAEHESRGEARDSGSSSTVRLPGPSTSPLKPAKWLPPALRQTELTVLRRTDTFDPTHPEPPRSPAPPNDNFTISLPKVSRRIEPLTKRQVNYLKYVAPIRWEILSFDPPVEGMTKKHLSVNDVLFRKPQGPYKSRKYRVLLPKLKVSFRQVRGNDAQGAVCDTASLASSSKGAANGTFGTPKSTQSNWRSVSASSRVEAEDTRGQPASSMLDVTSRSPPPDLAAKSVQVPTVSRVVSKPRSQKSLDVTDVGFYRDIRKSTDNNTNIPAVTFTVGSELEGQTDMSPRQKALALPAASSKALPGGNSQGSPEVEKSQSHTTTLETQSIPSGRAGPTSSSAAATQPETGLGSNLFERGADPFLQGPPVTPPPQNSTSSWPKSPARVPDPEHLKAVWSQPSNGDSVPAVNSLKNIPDDLTSVPFTLQEVKSEGGTPPPPPPGPVAPPTRMSASEVTRAFQTVPSGPSNGMAPTTSRGNQMPSSLGSPLGSQRALKPPSIGLPPPLIMNPNASRPPYMGYSTSMSNHTPSPPTMVYSHVMPNGMASSPVGTPYGQPIWMSVVQQGPQMLRAQSSSPYSPSIMPYSMPGVQNGMYSPQSSMSNPQGSPAAYPAAPPPQMMVSPIMAHASPVPSNAMYPGPGSPMVIHMPPPGTGPEARPYAPGPVGMGRGSLPMQNLMDPRSRPAPGPPAVPVSRFPVQNQGYTPVPPQSFGRPW